MTASAPSVAGLDELLLTMADDEFVIGFWDSEWTGIAPVLEEDVAFASLAQDEIGHAKALYEMLGELMADSAFWRALVNTFGIFVLATVPQLILATVLGNLDAVLGVFGTGAIGAALILIAGAFVIGYLTGTADKRERVVLGFATAQRNFAAATVVAVESFADRRVLVMTVVCSTIAMLLIPFAGMLGKRVEAAGDE